MNTQELKQSVTDLEARYKNLNSAIQAEETKAAMYKESLQTLAPKRVAIEGKVVEKFNCTIDELPAELENKHELATTELKKLEAQLKKLQPPQDSQDED